MQHSLLIDPKLTVELICNDLQEKMKEQNSNGLLLGLSGGIDSAVLAAIAVIAAGKEKVYASFLYDRDSEKSSETKAQIMADWLGIKLEISDISPVMHERGVYTPLIMKIVPYSSTFNRLIQYFYRLINGETPFKTTLKIGSGQNPDDSWLKRLMFNLSIRHIENGFTERHLYRRELLEKKAKEKNLTLIGAANRSEFEVGWFVKDGIDDLPIQPMTGLYKTQVWQLASYLELPNEIQSQLPSPDMMLGITDEFGIGHDYRRLDMILNMLEQKKTDQEIIAQGVKREELDDIRELMKFSGWKRASYHEIPPVQGGFNGNVRIQQ